MVARSLLLLFCGVARVSSNSHAQPRKDLDATTYAEVQEHGRVVLSGQLDEVDPVQESRLMRKQEPSAQDQDHLHDPHDTTHEHPLHRDGDLYYNHSGQKDPNIVTENAVGVGSFGGMCTCPDGMQYHVGDNGDDCATLACIHGKAAKCHRELGPWSNRKVECSSNLPETSGPPGPPGNLLEISAKVGITPAPTGPPGPPGAPGLVGGPGKDAGVGDPGETGPVGDSGPKGDPGDWGPIGIPGKPGPAPLPKDPPKELVTMNVLGAVAAFNIVSIAVVFCMLDQRGRAIQKKLNAKGGGEAQGGGGGQEWEGEESWQGNGGGKGGKGGKGEKGGDIGLESTGPSF